jgi:hypothetical protein
VKDFWKFFKEENEKGIEGLCGGFQILDKKWFLYEMI